MRFNSGGSGSFVSADGLVMTNHHVGADCLQKLSNGEGLSSKTGFHAKTRAEELKCVDLELNVLMSIEDVTERVNAAVKPDMSPAEAQKARRAVINTIEKESLDKTGLRSDVVTLYHGGQYHLYRYKKYTDVRLVFAPEKDDRLLRRRPGQLRVSALRPRHLLLPRLRERQAGQDRALPEVEQGRAPRTAS